METAVEKPLQKLFQFLYGPLFIVIDFFIRNYRANRDRVQKLVARKKASSFIQNAALIFLIVWILVFALGSEEHRSKFTAALKESFAELQAFTEN